MYIPMSIKIPDYLAPQCLAYLPEVEAAVLCNSAIGSGSTDLTDTDIEGLTWTEF